MTPKPTNVTRDEFEEELSVLRTAVGHLVSCLIGMDAISPEDADHVYRLVEPRRVSPITFNVREHEQRDEPPHPAIQAMDALRQAFEKMLVAEVNRFNGIPYLTPEEIRFREMVAELLDQKGKQP